MQITDQCITTPEQKNLSSVNKCIGDITGLCYTNSVNFSSDLHLAEVLKEVVLPRRNLYRSERNIRPSDLIGELLASGTSTCM